MPMMNDDSRGMTYREIAEAILAMPADKQNQRACYTMVDDEGFDVNEPVLELETISASGRVFMNGPNLYA